MRHVGDVGCWVRGEVGVGVRGGFVEAVDVVAGFDGAAAKEGRGFVVVVLLLGCVGVELEEERDHDGLEEDDDGPAGPC